MDLSEGTIGIENRLVFHGERVMIRAMIGPTTAKNARYKANVITGGLSVDWLCAVFTLMSVNGLLAETGMVYRFESVAPLPGATVGHSAVRLDSGDVLVVGGFGKLFGLPLAVNLARVYDVDAQRWRVIDSPMQYGRVRPGVVKLPCGKVLIAGGWGQDRKPMASIELFDPRIEQFCLIGKMSAPRSWPVLNLLQNGNVLVSGGTRHCEIIEPDPNQPDHYRVRVLAGRTSTLHDEHPGIRLVDGSVLLIGGRGPGFDLFDPVTETFQKCQARLPGVFDDMAAALLYDGNVLIAGGQEVYRSESTAQTWLYDPVGDRLAEGRKLNPTAQGRPQPGAADMMIVDLFAGDDTRWGRTFLLCGGEYDPGKKTDQPDVILDSAFVYDAVQNRWTDVGPMNAVHDEFAAVKLAAPSGRARILIIGGYGSDDTFHGDCEIFHYRSSENQN
jgi:hypothetical protein